MSERLKQAPRPASIIISDWLANCQVGQWTPFEAAHALMNRLQDEGYYVMRPDDRPASPQGVKV